MTLILAGQTQDGVVIAADTREVIDLGRGTHWDGAQKLMRLPGGVLVAFGGAGAWASALVLEMTERGKLADSRAEVVARELHAEVTAHPNFPRVPWLIAGHEPSPSLFIFDSRPMSVNDYVSLMRVRPRIHYVGCQEIARQMLHRLPETITTEQLAVAFVAAIEATAAGTFFVSPDCTVMASRKGGWSDADAAAAKQQARAMRDVVANALREHLTRPAN